MGKAQETGFVSTKAINDGLSGQILSVGQGGAVSERNAFTDLLNKLGRKDWVVHCCKRYEHGKGVANYLARYVRGGPFNNSQLVNVTDKQVTFSYQSHVSHKREILRLPVDTFISRWLEHVPQSGKALVRYCGLYSSASRDKLNQARKYHQQAPVSLPQLVSWQTYLGQWTEPRCEVCGCLLHHQEGELIRHAA